MTQLALELVARPRTAEELLDRLRELGLTKIARCRLTRNRRTMLSYRAAELRIHEGFLDAPETVLRAVVTLIEGRGRARRQAKAAVLAHPIAVDRGPRRREVPHPDDEPMRQRLVAEWDRLNVERFGGLLGAVSIRVSRRMKRRLGHFSPFSANEPQEIAISRRHIRGHGWAEAIETLLHEMVHQSQVESGHPLDHGPAFRRMAREVGITPRATRVEGSRSRA